MKRRALSVAPVIALLVPAAAHADHPGIDFSTGSAGPITTMTGATLPRGTTAFALTGQYVRSQRLSDDELKSRASRHIDAHSSDYLFRPSLTAAYGLTEDLTVGFTLPYVRRSDIREGEHAHVGGQAVNSVVERGSSSGIGDLTLLAKYRFVNNARAGHQAALVVGVKTPTGETRRADRRGERFETEHQPGSGSWDPLVGVSATQSIGQASFSASIIYTISTNGAQDTTLGNRASYNIGASYRIGGEEHHHGEHAAAHTHGAWDAVLELNGEWEGRQQVRGVTDAETGRNVIYLSPGVRYVSGKRWSAFVSVGVPVIQHVGLAHPVSDYRILTGIAWAP